MQKAEKVLFGINSNLDLNTPQQILTFVVIANIAVALISMPLLLTANAKSGLTIILKLKYSKFADSHPSIEVTGLKIPEGTKFEVHWNNPDTDDGEQIDMKNTKCKCKEIGTIRVP